MPGVPTGRSCDVCRARKKKCDEKQPKCSRCERLGLTCVGAGQKRYKFRYSTSSNTTAGKFKRDSWSPDDKAIRVSRPPSNDVTRTTSSFASILKVADAGHSILSFGQFFEEIPKRMGKNEALIASTKVLTSSARTFYTGAPTVQAFTHYGKALRSLRSSVSSAEDTTDCMDAIFAIGILCLSHNLLGSQRGEYEIHIRGLLSLLSKMPDKPLKSEFHKQGVSAAWALVIGECIMDPSIKIDQRLIDRRKRRFGPIATDPAGFTTEFYTLRWENLIPLPSQLHDPELYRKEIATTYQDMLLESPRLITIANQLSCATHVVPDQSLALQYILAETGNSELLSMSLVLNKTLQILDPTDTTLVKQAMSLVSEIIKATERLDQFKPLGTARLPPALCLAWVVAPTAEQRNRMREVLDDHVYDFRGVTWEDLAGRYERRFGDIRDRVRIRRLAFRVLE